MPLILVGLMLGVLADVLLRVPDAPALNMFVCLAGVAVAALVLTPRGRERGLGRLTWLMVAVLFAAGLVWRDAPPLKLLALGAVTTAFAVAAYRPTTEWAGYSGITRYAAAWAMGALHAWTAASLVLIDAVRTTGPNVARTAGWQRARDVVRGLAIAAPLVLVFGALFMSADAVFAHMVRSIVGVDLKVVPGHVLLTAAAAWLAIGYLRGYLAGTELPLLKVFPWIGDTAHTPRRVALSTTEIATAMAAIDVLFLAFVIVQFRYLFGGESLVQVTTGLTYADYARHGFFELVFAAFLVMPVLLAADWLLEARSEGDAVVFRALAGAQIVLVLAIALSALERLRLYYATYGLTEQRLYACVLLLWIGAMLVWLAATVLRGRRYDFAFGAVTSGLAVVVLLFVIAPDAVVARTNVARTVTATAPAPFDVAYAASLSGDAVPVLIDALPSLPHDVQCTLARHMLRSWPTDRRPSIRGWNWSAARASRVVRDHEAQLRSMAGPGLKCAAE